MTQEEKAKAYDEALEKAKAHINSKGIGDTVDLCKHLFSELREREDERMYEAIISLLKEFKNSGTLWLKPTVQLDDAISFLEKQKEPHIPWYDYQKSKEAGYTIVPNEEYEQLIKQKEQKPIDYPYLPGWRKNRDNNKPELKRSVLMLTTHGVAEGEWLGEKWCQYRWSCELKDGEVLYWIHLSDLERLEKEGEEKQKEQKPMDKIDLKFNIGDTIVNKKNGEKCTISNRCLLHQYYSDTNHCHEIKFDEQDDWELVEQKEQDKCPEYCVRSHCIGCSIYEKEKEKWPIMDVFGFKVGDAVRLKDGDGRKHIIKSFEEVEGVYGPNFYHVEFEDTSARDGIYPGEEYPNGYYTQMEKLEEVQGPPQEEKQVSLTHEPPFDENPSDKEIIEALIKHLKEQDGFLTAIDCVSTKAILSWLEKQKEQDKEEPKIAFGSWGDKEKQEAIITLIKYARWIKKITNEECKDLVQWLEQKPAEWSEEDADILNCCISSIEEAKENRYAYKETDGDTSYDREIDWLKSLRPSWKPSEEQMDALKELIDDANRAGWVTPGATELYEQLKKL